MILMPESKVVMAPLHVSDLGTSVHTQFLQAVHGDIAMLFRDCEMSEITPNNSQPTLLTHKGEHDTSILIPRQF
jgi:hypothetical protein